MLRSLLLFALALGLKAVVAQPQWRFHLAFENGDGARDTIWMVFDTNASQGLPVDQALGEGPVSMDANEFNVWMYNALGDSTKTQVWPYSWFPEMAAHIEGFNWQAPVTIRWDTALFHAPYLPGPDSIGLASLEGEHFFFYNNDPPLHAFNMLIDDSVVVSDPNEIGFLFPIAAGFHSHGDLGLTRNATSQTFSAWPVPLDDGPLHVHSASPCELQFLDALGQLVAGPITCSGLCTIPLPPLNPGSYLLRAITSDNRIHHAKVIK